MKRVAFATCEERPALTPSDAVLAAALAGRGAAVTAVPWTAEADWDGFDLVVVRSTWDYHRRAADFLRWTGSRRRLLNPGPVLRWNHHKGYLEELARRGVPVVPTRLLEAGEDAAAAAADSGWGEVVLKPAVSACADLTWRLDARDAGAVRRAAEAIRPRSRAVLQPFVGDVVARGETSLLFAQGRPGRPEFSHAVAKRAKPGDFRVLEEFGGTTARHAPTAAERETAERALAAVPGDWAYARVDLLPWRGSPAVGEVELIEPELYLTHDPAGGAAFARAFSERLA